MADRPLRKYPQLPTAVWQVDRVRLPVRIPRPEGEEAWPVIGVCLDAASRRMAVDGPVLEGIEEHGVLVDVLAKAGREWRARPGRVRVTKPELAEELRGLLAADGVAVELCDELPELAKVVAELRRGIVAEMPPDVVSEPDGSGQS